MCRFIFALVLLLATCTVLGAPAPKGSWDRPIDPDQDCKFASRGGTVTIEIPGTDHDLAPKRKRFNAPRVLRQVEGDFVMQARVSGSFHPSPKSSADGEDPSVAAGLVLIPADGNCIRLEYGAYRRKGEQRSCPAFRVRGEQLINLEIDWDVPRKKDTHAKTEEDIYSRLVRRGHFIYEAISPDGEEWTYEYRLEDRKLPAKLKVGLAAYSTSTEPFKAHFDKFKLQLGRSGEEDRNNIATFRRPN